MSVNLLSGTSEISHWNNDVVPSIKPADWLTAPLVEAGILSDEFYGARVAPIVVGLGFPNLRRPQPEESGFVKGSVDLDYLVRPPEAHFNPHAELKNRVRKTLEDRVAGPKKPRISLFPGYVFPDVAGGSLYLDDTLSDGECTVEQFSPASEVLGNAYNLGNICVGTSALVVSEYGYIPKVSLPSVIREALAPSKNGKIDHSKARFKVAAANVLRFQEQSAQSHTSLR